MKCGMENLVPGMRMITVENCTLLNLASLILLVYLHTLVCSYLNGECIVETIGILLATKQLNLPTLAGRGRSTQADKASGLQICL